MSVASESQRALVRHLQAVLAADVRIEATWLTGSFGRGEGDVWSDIDVIAVVDEDDRAACFAEYTGPKSPIGETVLARAPYGRIAHGVRPDWERYDILFLTPAELRRLDAAGLKPLTEASLDLTPAGPPAKRVAGPDPAVVREMAEEFLRILGLSPGAVGREEWLAAQEGLGIMRKLTLDMMFEANGYGRAERGGAKRLNPYLTPEQRAAMEALPLPAANRDALIAANTALARLFLPLAREVLDRAGAACPQALEDATRVHLERTLGLRL